MPISEHKADRLARAYVTEALSDIACENAREIAYKLEAEIEPETEIDPDDRQAVADLVHKYGRWLVQRFRATAGSEW